MLQAIKGLELKVLLCVCSYVHLYVQERVKEISMHRISKLGSTLVVSYQQKIPRWFPDLPGSACWESFLGDDSHMASFCLNDAPILAYTLGSWERYTSYVSSALGFRVLHFATQEK